MSRVPPLSVHAWLRYDAIETLLRRVEPRTMLEVGVGQGSVGALLAARFDYLGIELDEQAISTARRRFEKYGLEAARLIHGGLDRVRGKQFDLVCAFEVLEHFEDDRATLYEWLELVAVGGAVLLSVPAGPHRFAAADQKAGHFRRYDRIGLGSTLESVGFADVHMLNYGVPTGYVLEAARNALARRALRRRIDYQERTLASGRWLQPPDWAAPITRAIAAPLCALQRPFMQSDRGTGLVALARRR